MTSDTRNRQIHIFLAGDSTVANCPAHEAPMAGWGQVLGGFFTNDIKIVNEAKGGASTNSFIKEGRLDRITNQMEKGDYLFIQFGHNDQKEYGTDPHTTYKEYLLKYINAARDKGTTPVLFTSVHRRRFNENGKIINTLGDYPESVRQLARQEKVAYIDLWKKTKDLYESLGVEGSKKLFTWGKPGELPNYPNGIEDNTHFCEYGAIQISKLIVTGIEELNLPLKLYLKK